MTHHSHSHKRMDRAPAKSENALRAVMAGVFRKQKQEFADEHDPKSDALKPSRERDTTVVQAVRPILMSLFKQGGDKALRSIRKFPKTTGKMLGLGYTHDEVAGSVGVEWKAKPSASVEIPEWLDDPDVIDAIEEEMFYFAHQINQTTADALREELMEGMEAGEGIEQLKSRIAGLYDDWADGNRAEMIARTESARAYSKGHIEAWKSTGVVDRVVWVSALDACPFCLDMNGTVVDLGENFMDLGEEQEVEWNDKDITMSQDYSDVAGPPLHPNACFAGTPFASYGNTEQLVRSAYNGPAIEIIVSPMSLCVVSSRNNPHNATTMKTNITSNSSNSKACGVHRFDSVDDLGIDREKRTWAVVAGNIHLTIGPNHPVLTRRGWVNAGHLQKGDQLLYDARTIPLSAETRNEIDIKNVILFENAFDSFRSIGRNMTAAAASVYFHGDEVFAYGKVNVVRPTRNLLPVFDPMGIEHLCKCSLSGAYPTAEHVSGCSACRSDFERIFLSSSGGMSIGRESKTLSFGSRSPIPAQVVTVVSHKETSYVGFAFDASTSTAIYANGGFIVKNCRCAVIGELAEEKMLVQKEHLAKHKQGGT